VKLVYRTCIAIILTIGLAATFSSAEIDPNTVVGIWLLDEGSGKEAKDASGRGHNGEIIGDVIWVDGKFRTALEFPGTLTDCVEIESTPELQITDEITLMGWINTTVTPSADIVGKDDGTDRNYNIHVADSGKIFLNSGGEKCPLPGTTSVIDGQWHHVAGTWDGDTVRIYVDGVEEASSSFAGPIATSDVPVKIGLRGNGEGVDRIFTGVIDEVAIFNVALSEEDIQNLMVNGLEQLAPVEPHGSMATTWGQLKGER
jgi:hypothetical protein